MGLRSRERLGRRSKPMAWGTLRRMVSPNVQAILDALKADEPSKYKFIVVRALRGERQHDGKTHGARLHEIEAALTRQEAEELISLGAQDRKHELHFP